MHSKHYAAAQAAGSGLAPAMLGFPAYGPFWGGRPGGPFRRPKYNVPLNIVDTETAYEVHVYALGFAKENIRLAVVDDVLYISGTRTLDETNPPVFSRQEYPVKSFERTVSLRGQVDTGAIRARQEAGVLIVTLPKHPAAQQPAQQIGID